MSDIHGNLTALKRVLTDIDRSQIDSIVCLGDNVGYGPEPEAVIRRIRERNIPCVKGNHELGVCDSDYLEWFNYLARSTILLTRKILSPEAVSFCDQLPTAMVKKGCLCVHGCPPDSPLTYIFELSDIGLITAFHNIDQQICFVGHTHVLEMYSYNGKQLKRQVLDRNKASIEKNSQYIVNVGSVGQPRDGNNNSKYVIWDDMECTLEVRYVPYDIDNTANKILELGWPEFLATRLY